MNDLSFQGQFLERAVVRSLEGKLAINPSKTPLNIGVSHLPSSVVVKDIVSITKGSLSFFFFLFCLGPGMLVACGVSLQPRLANLIW